MNKKITIDDLTKEELIKLINSNMCRYSIQDKDVIRIRYGSMTEKAKKLADEAIAEMDVSKGIEMFNKWMEANKKFDKAMDLYEEADSMWLEEVKKWRRQELKVNATPE